MPYWRDPTALVLPLLFSLRIIVGGGGGASPLREDLSIAKAT